MPTANAPPALAPENDCQLLLENQKLRQEIQDLDQTLAQLQRKMEDGFDAGNAQILLLATYLE
jgi:hypothetical protein